LVQRVYGKVGAFLLLLRQVERSRDLILADGGCLQQRLSSNASGKLLGPRDRRRAPEDQIAGVLYKATPQPDLELNLIPARRLSRNTDPIGRRETTGPARTPEVLQDDS
jgi:hypothetical protein